MLACSHARTERAAEHGAALKPEHPAERLVDEGEPALAVAAQDDVGLAVEKIAVAGLVLADLPLDVLELLEPALETLADPDEAVELGPQVARTARQSRQRGRLGAVWAFDRLMEPGAQATRQGSELSHA